MDRQTSNKKSPLASSLGSIQAFLLALVIVFESEGATAQSPSESPQSDCHIDLSRPGFMKDIVSNALMLGLHRPESDVASFLEGAEVRYDKGQDLLEAAAKHFDIRVAELTAEVDRFKHCNCTHEPETDSTRTARKTTGDPEVTQFARDVTLHVVLHELGHALIREFDLPILGNEETMADAFATHFLTHHLSDRALDVLSARIQSLRIEAHEVPRDSWTVAGEHNSDARRAYQIAALALAADRDKYLPLASTVQMTESQIRKSTDYGSEIHRSWRRILEPLWMPRGLASREARLIYDDDSLFIRRLNEGGLAHELKEIIGRFDWHSQVTVRFVEGEGGAGWSRSKRTVTVHSEYVRRFVRQGKSARDRSDREDSPGG